MLARQAPPFLAQSGAEDEVYAGADGCNMPAVKARSPKLEIVTRRGKPVSVIFPIKDYEDLLERVEDAKDVAWLKRARRKPLQYSPLKDYLTARNPK